MGARALPQADQSVTVDTAESPITAPPRRPLLGSITSAVTSTSLRSTGGPLSRQSAIGVARAARLSTRFRSRLDLRLGSFGPPDGFPRDRSAARVAWTVWHEGWPLSLRLTTAGCRSVPVRHAAFPQDGIDLVGDPALRHLPMGDRSWNPGVNAASEMVDCSHSGHWTWPLCAGGSMGM